MKTLRKKVNSRKISLPAQDLAPANCNSQNKPKQYGSLWQNMKRKISFSMSQEGAREKLEENVQKYPKDNNDENYAPMDEQELTPTRMRRVNSDVAKEDILHFAIVESDISLLASILESSRVDINYLRPPGIAPLHQACMSGSLAIVEMLVRNGANIYLRDHKDLTPLQLANCYGYFEIAEYLLRMGSPVIDIKDGFQIATRKRKRSCFYIGPRGSSYEPVGK